MIFGTLFATGLQNHTSSCHQQMLLEDVKSVALDIASLEHHLMEIKTLCVPGYRDIIYANSRFQLFVTQPLMMSTTGIQKQFADLK